MKKRKQVYKEVTEEDSWLIKTWNTQRGRAGLKLGIYFIIMFVLWLIIMITGSAQPKEYNVTYKSYTKPYSEQLDELKENNFSYEYNITINNNKIIYKGDKDGVDDLGYKEDVNGVLKYYKNNIETYKINLDSKELITNLYEGINPELLDLEYIISLIENIQVESINNVYTYNVNGYQISVESSDSIDNIVIQRENEYYNLNFENVGSVEDIANPV